MDTTQMIVAPSYPPSPHHRTSSTLSSNRRVSLITGHGEYDDMMDTTQIIVVLGNSESSPYFSSVAPIQHMLESSLWYKAIVSCAILFIFYQDDFRLAFADEQMDIGFTAGLGLCFSIVSIDLVIRFISLPGCLYEFICWLQAISVFCVLFWFPSVWALAGVSQETAASPLCRAVLLATSLPLMIRLMAVWTLDNVVKKMYTTYENFGRDASEMEEVKEEREEGRRIRTQMAQHTSVTVVLGAICMLLIAGGLQTSFRHPAFYSSTSSLIYAYQNFQPNAFTEATDDLRIIWGNSLAIVNASGSILVNNANAIVGVRSSQLITFTSSGLSLTFVDTNLVSEAIVSLQRTTFILGAILITFIIAAFGAHSVIVSLERTVQAVNRLIADPLADLVRINGKQRAVVRHRGKLNETQLVTSTLLKLARLLQVGFGDAGAEIIAKNLHGNLSYLDPMIPGRKVHGVFGFCSLSHFEMCTEILEEEVMVFVNQIAEIIHAICHQHNGQVNRSLGGSFLLVWKLRSEHMYNQSNIYSMDSRSSSTMNSNSAHSRNPTLASASKAQRSSTSRNNAGVSALPQNQRTRPSKSIWASLSLSERPRTADPSVQSRQLKMGKIEENEENCREVHINLARGCGHQSPRRSISLDATHSKDLLLSVTHSHTNDQFGHKCKQPHISAVMIRPQKSLSIPISQSPTLLNAMGNGQAKSKLFHTTSSLPSIQQLRSLSTHLDSPIEVWSAPAPLSPHTISTSRFQNSALKSDDRSKSPLIRSNLRHRRHSLQSADTSSLRAGLTVGNVTDNLLCAGDFKINLNGLAVNDKGQPINFNGMIVMQTDNKLSSSHGHNLLSSTMTFPCKSSLAQRRHSLAHPPRHNYIQSKLNGASRWISDEPEPSLRSLNSSRPQPIVTSFHPIRYASSRLVQDQPNSASLPSSSLPMPLKIAKTNQLKHSHDRDLSFFIFNLGGGNESLAHRRSVSHAHQTTLQTVHQNTTTLSSLSGSNATGMSSQHGSTRRISQLPVNRTASTSISLGKLSDQALIAFLHTTMAILTSPTLTKWRKYKPLINRMSSFSVAVSFGLHVGWAIEGAIGSVCKIDASYLSPHVNLSSRLMMACKQYHVQILMSEQFYQLLHPAIRTRCRHTDRVLLKGVADPMNVYTFDIAVKDMKSKVIRLFIDGEENENSKSTEEKNLGWHGICSIAKSVGQGIEHLVNPKLSTVHPHPNETTSTSPNGGNSVKDAVDVVNPRLFASLAALQSGLPVNWVAMYNRAVAHYLEGEWGAAKDALYICMQMNPDDESAMSLFRFMESETREHREKIQRRSVAQPEGTAAIVESVPLLSSISSPGREQKERAPSTWKGYRILKTK